MRKALKIPALMATSIELIPPLDSNDEGFEFIEFDSNANRYLVPRYPPECVSKLISEHDIKNFIEKANEILARNEATGNPSKRDYKVTFCCVGLLVFLVGLFIIGVLLTNTSSYTTYLAAIGITLIYVGSVFFIVVIFLIRKTPWFLGSFDYFTQKISKYIEETHKKQPNLPIRWKLGTRVGRRNRRVQTYDLLYLVWSNKDLNPTEKIVECNLQP